jgi:hypothetical protein
MKKIELREAGHSDKNWHNLYIDDKLIGWIYEYEGKIYVHIFTSEVAAVSVQP